MKQIFEEDPTIKAAITMPDGNIYCLPNIVNVPASKITPKTFINTEWMKRVGVEMPTTTEEFYQMLKTFKENDGNGNGKDDEIPLGINTGIDTIILGLRGSWGLGTRGSSDFDIDPEGNLRFIKTDPHYKEVLQYINGLYKERLLDNDCFSPNIRTEFSGRGAQDLYGCFMAINHTYVGPDLQDKFEGLPAALKGPHGDQMFSGRSNAAAPDGSFVITKVNKYPEVTMRWVDYLYTEEGAMLWYVGIEDVTCEKLEDGTYDYLPEIKNPPEGMTYQQSISRYVPWVGGNNPMIATQKYFRGPATLPISAEAARRLEPYISKIIWPTFIFTAEENERMATLGKDINTYISEMTAKFITGDMPFSEWDTYINTLKKMGLDEYIEINKQAIERMGLK